MVLIFTEAGKQFGYGHLMRCLAIAEGFKKIRVRPIFYLRGNLDSGEILRGFSWKSVDWLKEPVDIKNKIVILDSYYAPENYCKEVYGEAKTALFIDDYKRIPYPGGFVLNSAIGAKDMGYPYNPKIIYLLGPKYHPLRHEFWEFPKKVIRKCVEQILVTFGGSDMANVTPKILKMLKEQYPDFEKRVIIGKGFSNIKEIKAEADKKTVLIYYPDAKKMKQEMLEADICISGGGQTLYELLSFGVPTIAVCCAQNQRLNLECFERIGFIENIGWHRDPNLLTSLNLALVRLSSPGERLKRSRKGRGLIDGKGASRLASALIKFSGLKLRLKGKNSRAGQVDKNIRLVKASEDDAKIIWEWRNHPEIRKRCSNLGLVSWEEHQKWFFEKIKDIKAHIYMVLLGKNKAGVIRFEDKGKNIVVSVNLDPVYFGRGMGSIIIELGTKKLLEENNLTKTILASIKPDNIASQKAFIKAGYRILEKKKNAVICGYKLG